MPAPIEIAPARKRSPPRIRHLKKLLLHMGPAFVASVAYIDPGNFAANFDAGARFGYKLLWVLLWSNAMAILIQYLSAKLGITTGETLPQNCRRYFSRRSTILLWIAGEISAVATDLAEFLGAALGFELLFGGYFHSLGWSNTETLLFAAALTAVLVFALLALEQYGFRRLELAIMAFVAVIGVCYAIEVWLVHPAWAQVGWHVLVPETDSHSIFDAVSMLGATVMPHVVYLHSALVQPRLKEHPLHGARYKELTRLRMLFYEKVDVMVAMNGAWLVNSAMVLVAAAAFGHGDHPNGFTIEEAHQTLGPLLGPASAAIFAVALLCSGLSSSTVGTMAGQVVLEGFLHVKFSIFLRRLLTLIPAVIVIGTGLEPIKIILLSQVILSFTLPFALIPLLLLTNREDVMGSHRNGRRTRYLGWTTTAIILVLNAALLVEAAMGNT